MPKDQISCKRPNRRQTNPGCVLLSNTDASSVAKQPHNMLLPACSNTEALLQVNADHQPVKYRCCRTSESAKGWHVQSKIQRRLGWPTPASADGPTALGSVSVHPLTHLGSSRSCCCFFKSLKDTLCSIHCQRHIWLSHRNRRTAP